ncbi:hypothetical protein C8J57DRAFT_1288153 [Mycena rebaudengoi]|nr:hypothetical protein C8J57DRAFT_1288153 [Mycena rebaudengoi]
MRRLKTAAKKSGAHGSCKRGRKMPTETSSHISNVPPELWTHIASFCSRQSLSRLCVVSHAFYSVLILELYGTMIEPPLNSLQTSRLFNTLAGDSDPEGRQHPGLLIRALSVKNDLGSKPTDLKAQSQIASSALKRLYEITVGRDQTAGSALRVLHWDMVAGIDRLGTILGVPGRFPNLKEIFVTTRGTNTNFNFVQIPGLEVLGCILHLEVGEVGENYENCATFYKFCEAIQMVPTSSPLLRTLKLEFFLEYDTEFPHFAFDEVVAAINTTHLPSLTTLDLRVHTYDLYRDFDDEDPIPADFSPFLGSHPHIEDLTLDAAGTEIPADAKFISQLRAFTGTFDMFPYASTHFQHLTKLVLSFVDDPLKSLPLPFDVLPSVVHTTLTALDVRSINDWGSMKKPSRELRPSSFSRLVSPCTNITHLNVCLSTPLRNYRQYIALLIKLQSLHVQEYQLIHLRAGKRRPLATKRFPASRYIAEIGAVLPSLPDLVDIDICVVADIVDWDEENPEGYYSDLEFESPPLRVDYKLSVLRKSGKATVVLDRTQTFKDRNTGF